MVEEVEYEGRRALRVRDGGGELAATFVPGAGMAGVSLRHRGEELLGQRRGLGAYVRDARTLGIPLLHPWANRLGRDGYAAGGVQVALPRRAPGLHRDGNGLAIHGLLAGAPEWRVETGAGAPEGGFAATFDFAARADLLPSFPFPHMLRIEAAVADGALRIATQLTATGAVPVPVAYGFHPYLRLPGASRGAWAVELPARRRLALDARGIPSGAAEHEAAERLTLGERTYDDAYDGLAPGAAFALAGGGRRVEVRFERGFPAGQVYAPPDDDVVCFEPMAAPVNALVSGAGLRLVRPGERDTAAFSIAVAAAGAGA